MGFFNVSDDLPDGWMEYVERGKVVYYSGPELVTFQTKEHVHKYIKEKFAKNGQQLVDAIYKNKNEQVQVLLAKMDPSNLNQAFKSTLCSGQVWFPLQVGCMVNNCDAIERLLDIPGIDVNVNAFPGSRMTPVMNAAENCHPEALRLMLGHPGVWLRLRNAAGKGLEQLVNQSRKYMAVKSRCLEMIKEAKRRSFTLIQETKRRRISRDLDQENEVMQSNNTSQSLQVHAENEEEDMENYGSGEENGNDESNNYSENDQNGTDEEVSESEGDDGLDERDSDDDDLYRVGDKDEDPTRSQSSPPVNEQSGLSLEDVRANIRRQYTEQIDKANVEIQNREQKLNENLKLSEKRKMNLKEKYIMERNKIELEEEINKIELEEEKSKLELQLIEVRQKMSELRQKVRRRDREMKKRYDNEHVRLDKMFNNENAENKQYIFDLKEKTKQLSNDLNKILELDSNGNKSSSNLEAAKRTLECPVCMELMSPPTRIWMCKFSHLVCENCKYQLGETRCPTCRTGRVKYRAFMAENFATTLLNQ